MPGESSAVPTEDRVGLNHLQTSPPTGPESRQHNPQESVAAVEAQATRGVLLENCKLVTKREDLRLQGRTGSKTGGYQSEKGDEKRAHRGSHHDLTIDRNLSVFRSDGIFGNHTPGRYIERISSMLQAVQRAELEALLRAAGPPSPSGSLPAPLSTQPTSPQPGCRLAHCGVAVIRKGQETPSPSPPTGPGGDREIRQANQKPRVEYWHELLAYIDAGYCKKFGRHYPWDNLARKNAWNLARVHSPWRVMALWDSYLERQSWWARKTNCSIYGMVRDLGWLMDDPRLKQTVLQHDAALL